MLEWARSPARVKLLSLSGLFAGLAMTNQQTFVLLAPGLVAMLEAMTREAAFATVSQLVNDPAASKALSRDDGARAFLRNLKDG